MSGAGDVAKAFKEELASVAVAADPKAAFAAAIGGVDASSVNELNGVVTMIKVDGKATLDRLKDEYTTALFAATEDLKLTPADALKAGDLDEFLALFSSSNAAGRALLRLLFITAACGDKGGAGKNKMHIKTLTTAWGLAAAPVLLDRAAQGMQMMVEYPQKKRDKFPSGEAGDAEFANHKMKRSQAMALVSPNAHVEAAFKLAMEHYEVDLKTELPDALSTKCEVADFHA